MSENIIEFKDLRKTYHVGNQTVDALAGISLEIKKVITLQSWDPPDRGKSTLMNITGCLDTPSSGKYVLNNQDVSQLEDEKLAAIRNKEIGFVFQTFNLLTRYNAMENVVLPLLYAGIGKAERTKRAAQALENVGLGDRADHKPNEMSGGQRQRVAVARALINNPAIILADEPTGNLDSKTSYDIMQLFGKIHAQGNTIILVTHEDDIAQYAHRIVRLLDGHVEYDIKTKISEPEVNPIKWIVF